MVLLFECNTAYPGARDTTEKHKKLMEEHGWSINISMSILWMLKVLI